MLHRVWRKWSRSHSKPETSVALLKPEQATGNASKLSLTASAKELVAKLAFAPEQPVDECAPRQHTLSLNTKWSERTVFNNTDTGILSLPAEILLYLQRYLSSSSEVSLRQSCSRFFYLYSSPSFYLSGDDKFDFICMVERDQDPTLLRRLVCGQCHDLHSKSMFPASEIARAPLDRDCRQVWLCPHQALGYGKCIRKIKAGADSPFRAENVEPCNKCREVIRSRTIADRPERSGAATDLQYPTAESMLVSKIALLQAPSPSHATRGSASGLYTETFPVKDVADALQALDFPICLHIRLGDPFILSKFCRACINTAVQKPGHPGPNCISEVKDRDVFGRRRDGKCKGTCYTRGCKTKFMFQSRESLTPDASGKRQVWLIIAVYRWLGPLLDGGKDSTWLDHSTKAQERMDMRIAWANWMRTIRQPMPNWSICLLHPEDCNLR